MQESTTTTATATTTTSTAAYLTQEALGGLAAGVIGTIIGYPLDVMKTRLQTQGGSSGSSSSSKNGLSILVDIVRQDGVVGLYRGVGPPLISLSLLNTMSFTSYSYFREFYGGRDGWDINNGLAGMTGAPTFGLISTVENRLKTQMQLQPYVNSWQCAKYLVQHDGGLASLYKGHVVNTIREAVFVANYFFIYEGMRELLIHRQEPTTDHHQHQRADDETTTTSNTMIPMLVGTLSPQLAIPVAGGIAGMTSWAVSFPLDCVRAGVQGQTVGPSRRSRTTSTQQNVGAMTVLRQVLRQHGIAGLYNGVGPSIARAFLVSGSRFSAYETAIWLLRGEWRSSSSSSSLRHHHSGHH
jgi:solute carrier family 25 (mitochondrial carnitine/acylcarnitine transporter), member 20/29